MRLAKVGSAPTETVAVVPAITRVTSLRETEDLPTALRNRQTRAGSVAEASLSILKAVGHRQWRA